jgi:hypothetical protein
MTSEEAIAKAKTQWWKEKTPEEIVAFQLYEDKLCMDFGDFHKAVEDALGRGVFTHEFAYSDNLKREFEGKVDAPSFADILGLIPKDKRVIVVSVDD